MNSLKGIFDRLFAVNMKGTFFTLQMAAKYVADHGRIIYVGSGTTAFALPGRGLYGGSKIAAQHLVEALANEIGLRPDEAAWISRAITEMLRLLY